jgi:hypothetical protein
MRWPRLAEAVAAAMLAILANAGMVDGAELSTEAAVQGRSFAGAPLRTEQHGAIVSLSLRPEFYHDWRDGDHRLVAELFGRWDSADDKRTHADIRELYWRGTFRRDLDLYIGFRRVFWGVTETVHLVDIINQTDLIENIDGEQKLGQPMVASSWSSSRGMFELLLMPLFRERTFASAEGRPGLPLPVEVDQAEYESGAAEIHFDWAARYSHYVGDLDFGLAWFTGTDRLPTYRPDDSGTRLIPRYELMKRLSLDAQLTRGSWLWKVESVVRERRDEISIGAVGGFEYTFFGTFDSAADLGVLLELQYDDRDEPLVADNDLAAGVRLALNDVADTQLLAFASVDIENGGMFGSVEGSRRLGMAWRLGLELRLFMNTDPDDLLHALRHDDYMQVELTRYF